MNIAEAIERLESLSKQYGSTTQVFFDCPNCLQSFTPNRIAALAVHISTEKK